MAGNIAALAQTDFSAGILPSIARHLIPTNGLYDLQNGLLNNDGNIYRRGGSQALSTTNVGSSGLRFVWSGHLTPGERTFFADADNFGVLDGSEAPVDLGGSGVSAPPSFAAIDGLLFIGGGTIYGGSRKSADYSTGTVSMTNGSTVVTGSGTSWSANVDAGMLFRHGAERVYVVASVDSNTQITLTDAYEGATDTGEAYTLKRLETASAPYKTSDTYTVAGNRLIACDDNIVYFSGHRNPHAFGTDDFHKLPEATIILAAHGIEDSCLLLTTGGLWRATNLEFELFDDLGNPQQALNPETRDVVVWSAPGVANWSGSVIVPATDGVWLLAGGSWQKISSPIDRLYNSYVAAGYQTGQAIVFNGHYILPILDSSALIKDVLVCKLDRPVEIRGFGRIFPWTRLAGNGAKVTALTQRVGTATRQPKLLGASRAASGTYTARVLDLTGFFSPTAALKNDHDGTTHEFRLETRDFATGQLNKNLVKRLRLGYRMLDAASDNPTIAADFSDGAQQTTGSFWGSAFWGTGTWTDAAGAEYESLAGTAPEDDGRTPYVWSVRKRARHIRFRLRCQYPTSELTIRTLEIFTRPSRRL